MSALPFPELQRAAVVYHPLKSDAEQLRNTVAKHQPGEGWAETLWFETSPEDAGQGVTTEAVAQGATVVLAVGGDGTVRAVAESLRGSDTALCVVPEGTGNLLARNLNIPLNSVDAAVALAFTGSNRRIDLGVVHITRPDGTHGEHVFLVLAGLGLDAKMIGLTQSGLKHRVGWLAYVDGGIRAMLLQQPIRVRYQLDAQPPATQTVYSVMIGNCGQLPGGVLLIPDASPDDGRLDIVALRPNGRLSWLNIWRTLTWENGVLRRSRAGRRFIDLKRDARSVTYRSARTFSLELFTPEQVQLDGDEFGTAVAARGRVAEGALLVRVSAEEKAGGSGRLRRLGASIQQE